MSQTSRMCMYTSPPHILFGKTLVKSSLPAVRREKNADKGIKFKPLHEHLPVCANIDLSVEFAVNPKLG